MVTTQLSFLCNFPGLHPPPASLCCRNGRHFFTLISSSSFKNSDSSDGLDVRLSPSFVLRVPNTTLVRSAVTLFGLGFVDAGYSGDWSRIGVISEETELLRIAAFAIVPICLVLLFSIPTESD